jgi:hypothetical protein
MVMIKKLYVKNFRCPVCGHIVNVRNLYKYFPIEVFIWHGLGYGRGFKPEAIEDKQIVDLVKQKIRTLYLQFFGHEGPVKKFKEVVPLHGCSAVFEDGGVSCYDVDKMVGVFDLEGWGNVGI